jgi:disulfide oxidoreductase YuzD
MYSVILVAPVVVREGTPKKKNIKHKRENEKKNF